MSEHYLFKTHKELIENHEIAGRNLTDIISEIQTLYLGDDRPWIIGFSGGKDSTCVLSLIYYAVSELDEKTKPIYIVSSDTLVETPVVVDQINNVLWTVEAQGQLAGLTITANPVHPKSGDTFWVNLLGKGYPAPQQKFRWCTERMKIDPVSEFIKQTAASSGEVILALGSRSQESASRSQVINKHKIKGSLLGRHTTLPNAYTYMPISDWSADDVWEYLLLAPCPWGGSNRALFDLYKGSNQGECPLVIDKSTPSCGNSRFGCWTCTVVTKDRALEGLIESGEDWMKPLVEFRNKIHKSTNPEVKHEYRNWKRRTGKVSYFSDQDIATTDLSEIKNIPGPYWLDVRKSWLRELLEIEKTIRDQGKSIDLIKRYELEAIRREWLRDPNEPDWEDSLPKIYHEVYPDDDINWVMNDNHIIGTSENEMLHKLSSEYSVPAELVLKLIEQEIHVSGLGKRRGIIDKLETILNKDWESLDKVNERNVNVSKNDIYVEQIDETKEAYEAFIKAAELN